MGLVQAIPRPRGPTALANQNINVFRVAEPPNQGFTKLRTIQTPANHFLEQRFAFGQQESVSLRSVYTCRECGQRQDRKETDGKKLHAGHAGDFPC